MPLNWDQFHMFVHYKPAVLGSGFSFYINVKTPQSRRLLSGALLHKAAVWQWPCEELYITVSSFNSFLVNCAFDVFSSFYFLVSMLSFIWINLTSLYSTLIIYYVMLMSFIKKKRNKMKRIYLTFRHERLSHRASQSLDQLLSLITFKQRPFYRHPLVLYRFGTLSSCLAFIILTPIYLILPSFFK